MLTMSLYKFAKKRNSTKIPTNPVTTVNIELVDATSIVSPSVRIVVFGDFVLPDEPKEQNVAETLASDGAESEVYPQFNPADVNYAYIAEFKRYYYIAEWTYNKGFWTASLLCDVLASYKPEIGASTQYILRSASNFDTSIVDTMYPARSGCDVQSAQFVNPFTAIFNGGTYVLGVINSDGASNGIGAVSYYLFTPTQFNTFRNLLMGSIDWMYEGITEIGSDLTKAIFNPFQYIASCMWFPVTIGGTAITKLPYGWWSLDCACSRMSATGQYSIGDTVAIPKHPQSASFPYLNDAPYSQYKFDWACFGTIPIDPKYLYGVSQFGYIVQIDLVTGKAVLELRAVESDLSVNRLCHMASGQIGVPIQMAQLAIDYADSAAGGVTTLMQGIAGVAYGAITGKSLASIGDSVQNAFAQLYTSGTNGSASAFYHPPRLQGKFLRIVGTNQELLGRPCLKSVQISTLSGFVLCQNPVIEIRGTEGEAQEIVRFMDSGFFYE